MDTRRLILYAALGLTFYFIMQAWQHDYPGKVAAVTHETTQGLPDLGGQSSEKHQESAGITLPQKQAKAPAAPTSTIDVQTDVLHFKIDLNQGEVIQATLLNYPVSIHDSAPFEILSQAPSRQFIAKSQLVSMSQTGLNVNELHYQTTNTRYVMGPQQKQLLVQLVGQTDSGLKVIKTFRLERGSYLMGVSYELVNQTDKPWRGYLNTQLVQSSPPSSSGGLFQIGTYSGPSYSEPGVHQYQKYPFQTMEKSNLDVKAKGGWIAMQQHYFLVSWIPLASQNNTLYTRALDGTYTIGTLSQPIEIQPNQKAATEAKLYIGPELTHNLRAIAPGLDLTVDYGWFWFISSALFSIMKWMEAFLGNWGFAIICVTVLIKLCFYRLSASSYRSMAGMRQIQPKIEALKARFGDDKTKLSQATMELYRAEKINPFGGCLPIVIQIPVFIALYWVLIESVELRQAPFIFWIHDLAAPDPFHVLPVIMGLSMLMQQRLNPAPPDPMQAKMMMMLPILFTGIFWNFPAGLVLYWIVNNCLSILQQWWITRRIEQAGVKAKK